MKQAAAIPFRHLQHDSMTTLRSLLRLLVVSFCLGFVQPFAAVAQTNAPAPLPPAAQEALNKGIIAAKVPDYQLAIRYFEEARKLAPEAPVVYLNLGLAESRIPGRELRAMAWFGAYLAAYPDAPNTAAVKEQVGVLDIRNQSNISRLIQTLQDSPGKDDRRIVAVAKLWADLGNITAALKTADLIQNDIYQGYAQRTVANAQAEAGDIAGALKTAGLIRHANYKSRAQRATAEAQIKAGDIAGARKTIVEAQMTADLIKYANDKTEEQTAIAEAQIKAGDIAGAQKTLASAVKTADPVHEGVKSYFLRNIAITQVKAGDIAGAQQTADLIQDASENKGPAQGAIAEAQATAGDIAGALKTADLMRDASAKSRAQNAIAKAQIKSGDIAGAQKTADLIQNESSKFLAQREIVQAKAKIGVTNALSSNRQSLPDTQPPIQSVTTFSDWLKRLDDEGKSNVCALNTGPFLNLAGYLKSLPPSDNPQTIFDNLRETAEKFVAAKNVIEKMLKQQAKR